MPLLAQILIASIAGGLLSLAIAAVVAFRVRARWIPTLVSYAVGALLAAVFIDILPHVFEVSKNHGRAAGFILAGILVFFVLEKLLLWRHCHTEHCEVHDTHAQPHDHGRSGALIVVGDTVHNFVDGILIAAAFLQSTQLGVITAVAIVAHEIPQEVGDFLILLHSGYSKTRALVVNVLSSLATLVGGVLGYFALQTLQHWEPVLLGVVAASMIYVAVADLIPGLHKRPELRHTVA